MSLPVQRSEIESHLMHADWFASQGMTAQAAALYRTAAMKAEHGGNLRAAAIAYASVARFEGPGSDARVRLGELQLRLGRHADAAATLDAAARDALSAGQIPLGLQALRLAADAEPTATRWMHLRDWCLHVGQRDEAIEHLRYAVTRSFNDKDVATCICIAKALLQLLPDDPDTLRRLIRAYLQRGDLHRAAGSLQALLRSRPSDADALECMAEAFASLGRKDKAAEVVARLAHNLIDQGLLARAEARRLVHRGLGWSPEHPTLRELRRRLDARPRPTSGQRVVPSRTPALDMEQFAEAALRPPPREHTVALDIRDLELLDELSGLHRAPQRS